MSDGESLQQLPICSGGRVPSCFSLIIVAVTVNSLGDKKEWPGGDNLTNTGLTQLNSFIPVHISKAQ